MMKKIETYEQNGFNDERMSNFLVHESPYMKVLSFNFRGGQDLPIHSHDIDGQLCLVVIEGKGQFLGKDGSTISAKPGDILISDISEPHGLQASTDMRVLVTIAPPI